MGKAYPEFPDELLSKSEYKRRLKAAEKEKADAAKAAEKVRSHPSAAAAPERRLSAPFQAAKAAAAPAAEKKEAEGEEEEELDPTARRSAAAPPPHQPSRARDAAPARIGGATRARLRPPSRLSQHPATTRRLPTPSHTPSRHRRSSSRTG